MNLQNLFEIQSKGEFPVNETWTHEKVVTHKTIVTYIGLNFLKFDDDFRRIRKRVKGCQLCSKVFKYYDWMHLGFTDKGNKLMCESCKNKAIENGVNYHNEEERRKKRSIGG